ncbi:Uncharacterised protein [uncultured archaeon]|nr:Uncharacterised protein [uncultured archaeon]
MKNSLKKRIGKRGIVLSTVVGLIILILGFAILLFAYYQMNWNGNVDRQVCHQSVVYRATLPSFAGAKEYVPLKCKTGKICITSGFVGGKCNEFANSDGVTYIKVRDSEDIEQAVAKEILSCWETMGEGKLSLFSNWLAETYGIGQVTSSCIICSRIAYDKTSLARSGINLSSINVLNYMITHAAPGKKQSYYVYMAGSGGKLAVQDNRRGTVELESITPENDNRSDQLRLELESVSNDSDVLGRETSVMFMQVASPSYSDVLKNSALTLLGGTAGGFALAPTYAPKAAMAAVKSPIFWGVLAIFGVYQYNSVSSNQAFTAGHCGDISVGDKSGYGCSVVRTVDYDEANIGQYCSVIESIP